MSSMLSSHGHDPRQELDSGARRMLHLAQNLRDLASRDIGSSTTAAGRLNELAPTATELVTLTSDPNPFVRSGAAWWTRNLTGELCPDLIDALRAAIYDRNAHVVQAALGSAGVLRLTAARADVRDRLDDSDSSVVHSAIFALGRIGPSEEGAHLLRFLQSPETHLELAAVTALTQLRHSPAIPLLMARLEACRGTVRRLRSHFELPRRCMAGLVAMRAAEAAGLLVRFAQDEIGLRGMAVQALISLRAEEAAPALLSLLNRLLPSTHEEKLCCSLLVLMTAVDYRFAMPDVRAFLGHRLAGVRCTALKAVARWQDGEAVEVVRQMALQDGSAFVRPVAVTTLAELLGAEALPDLQTLAEDANSLVRGAVAEALAEMPALPAGGRNLLLRLVADSAAPVARIASEALASLPDASQTSCLARKPASEILPAELREHAAAARGFLRRWLGELPEAPEAKRPELEGAIQTLLRALAG